jgi:phosphoribosylformimino-5-aminoimidazole carboxamide ribotide isomerase
MKLLPAIDLRGGKCVRLRQGKDSELTVYGDDPVAVADGWVKQGAGWLHLVNLDGAFGRASENLSIVQQIASGGRVKVEFGGGLRSEGDVARIFGMGVEKAVIGTLAFINRPALRRMLQIHGAGKIVVAIDAKDGIVATEGWMESTGVPVVDAAKELERDGIREVLYTDVSRDGMMVGPDIVRLKELLSETRLSVIASGGVSSLADLQALLGLQNSRLSGVIVGKALYEGEFSLLDALKIVER